MSKCMYQECNNEATKTISCFIGSQKNKGMYSCMRLSLVCTDKIATCFSKF